MGKTFFKIMAKTLIFPLKIALIVFFDKASDAEIKAKKKRSEEYDRYAEIITKHKIVR